MLSELCENRVIFLAGRSSLPVCKICGTCTFSSFPRQGLIALMEHESATPQWDVLTAELRAYRDLQKQTWGDVDSALMGRYLAGEATAEERSRVEASFDQHPDLRVLADLVRDVLGEGQPVPLRTSVEEPEPGLRHLRLLPFTK